CQRATLSVDLLTGTEGQKRLQLSRPGAQRRHAPRSFRGYRPLWLSGSCGDPARRFGCAPHRRGDWIGARAMGRSEAAGEVVLSDAPVEPGAKQRRQSKTVRLSGPYAIKVVAGDRPKKPECIRVRPPSSPPVHE